MLKKFKLSYLICLIICGVALLTSFVSSIIVSNNKKIMADSFTTTYDINRDGDAEVYHYFSVTTQEKIKELKFYIEANDSANTNSSYIDITTLSISFSSGGTSFSNANGSVFLDNKIMCASNFYHDHNLDVKGKKLNTPSGQGVIYLASTKGYLNSSSSFYSVSIRYTLKNVVKIYDDYALLNLKFLNNNIKGRAYTFTVTMPSYSKDDLLKESVKVIASPSVTKYKDDATSTNRYRIYKSSSTDKEKYVSANTNVTWVLDAKRFNSNDLKPNFMHKKASKMIFANATLKAMNYFNLNNGVYVILLMLVNIVALGIYLLVRNWNLKNNLNEHEVTLKLNPITYHFIKGDLRYKPREIVNYLIYHAKVLLPTMKNNTMYVSCRLDCQNETLLSYFKKVVAPEMSLKRFYEFLRKNKKEVKEILTSQAITNQEITPNKSLKNIFVICFIAINVILMILLGIFMKNNFKLPLVLLNAVIVVILTFNIFMRGMVSDDSLKDYYYYHLYKNKEMIDSLPTQSLNKYEELIPYAVTLKYEAPLIYLAEGDMMGPLNTSSIARSHTVIEYLLRGHY